MALRRLSIDTTQQNYAPLDSFKLHCVLELVLDVLRSRPERCADTMLSLEHAIGPWTPLAPHRWMLHAIASLCRGKFRFRKRNGGPHHELIEVKLSELFTPAELRRLSAGYGRTNEASNKSEEDTVDQEARANEAVLWDHNNTSAMTEIHPDEREEVNHDEYSVSIERDGQSTEY